MPPTTILEEGLEFVAFVELDIRVDCDDPRHLCPPSACDSERSLQVAVVFVMGFPIAVLTALRIIYVERRVALSSRDP